MAKIFGLGGATEKITWRNPAQQKLGVAMEKFNSAATLKGVDGIPGYEDLKRKIDTIMSELAKLQGDLWDLERKRDTIIQLETKMAEAFQQFMLSVMRIGSGGIAIVKLVEPTFNDNPSKAELDAKIADPVFIWSLLTFAKEMTDVTFSDIETTVKSTQSIDFSKAFGSFTKVREAFTKVKSDIPKIEADISTKRGEITGREADKAIIEGTYNELKPLYDTLKKLESSWNLRTGVSRIVNMLVWAWVATSIAVSGVANFNKSTSKLSTNQSINSQNTANTSSLLGHQISLAGNTISISPANGNGAYLINGNGYQLNISGDITTGATGTLNYKLAWWTILSQNISNVKNGINLIILPGGKEIKVIIAGTQVSITE